MPLFSSAETVSEAVEDVVLVADDESGLDTRTSELPRTVF